MSINSHPSKKSCLAEKSTSDWKKINSNYNISKNCWILQKKQWWKNLKNSLTKILSKEKKDSLTMTSTKKERTLFHLPIPNSFTWIRSLLKKLRKQLLKTINLLHSWTSKEFLHLLLHPLTKPRIEMKKCPKFAFQTLKDF